MNFDYLYAFYSASGRPQDCPPVYRTRIDAGIKIFQARQGLFDEATRGRGGAVYRTRETREKSGLVGWECSCHDYQYGTALPARLDWGGYSGLGKMCKHTIAHLIAKFEGVELPPAPPAQPVANVVAPHAPTLTQAELESNPYYRAKNGLDIVNVRLI